MESMLSMASAKMTGLDLGGHHKAAAAAAAAARSTSTDEMLSTPKLIPDSAGLMSPRGFQANPSSSSKSRIPAAHNHNHYSQDDMLMTPVLTTPKTLDLWPISARDSLPLPSFSPPPENSSSDSPMDLGPREPPKDLPMDSDIGLRSPCDGLLAKRRKFKTQQAASSTSVNSDSNSCDTPTSQNSPRDLTTRGGCNGDDLTVPHSRSNAVVATSSATVSNVQVKLEFNDPKSPNSILPVVTSSTTTTTKSQHNFKHPSSSNKPEKLRFSSSSSMSDLDKSSHHYNNHTPSPLVAVPSPNWSAVERNFGQEFLRTPKQLDTNVFDFLTPPPITPRSRNCLRDRSPGSVESNRYSGRDQDLSPRTSPRFPIPEAPTDLSKNCDKVLPFPNGLGDPPPYPEDLSTKPKSPSPPLPTAPPSIPPPPPCSSSSITISTTTSMTNPMPPLTQVKQEFTMEEIRSRSRTPSGGPTPPISTTDYIKTEVINVTDEFEYKTHSQLHQQQQHQHQQQMHQQQQHPSSFQAPLYLAQHFQTLYSRYGTPTPDFGGRLQQTPITSRVQTSSPSLVDVRYEPNNPYVSQCFPQTQQQHQQQGNEGRQWPPSYIHEDEDESMSPPPTSSYDPRGPSPLMRNNMSLSVKTAHSLSSSPIPPLEPSAERKRRGKSATPSGSPMNEEDNNSSSQPKKKNKGKGKAAQKAAQGETGGPKRVYTCPHCQRSYDWNYNLNRHLKYECGKENAFQCAKCGRKFPHKQNCVYHLKRKHKIVCESIDQYVSAGLVVFRGGAGNPSDGQPAVSEGMTASQGNNNSA